MVSRRQALGWEEGAVGRGWWQVQVSGRHQSMPCESSFHVRVQEPEGGAAPHTPETWTSPWVHDFPMLQELARSSPRNAGGEGKKT